MAKPNIIVRKSAAHWDVQVLVPPSTEGETGEYVLFDMRRMSGKQRSSFHREFMRAFRENRN